MSKKKTFRDFVGRKRVIPVKCYDRDGKMYLSWANQKIDKGMAQRIANVVNIINEKVDSV